MPLINLALVVEARRIAPAEVQEVAAALQLQISRDFAPIWEVDATIDGFTSLDRVPPGYWVILVRDNLPMKGIVGIHLMRRGSLTPSCARPRAGRSRLVTRRSRRWPIRSAAAVPGSCPAGSGSVETLVEVRDPVGSPIPHMP